MLISHAFLALVLYNKKFLQDKFKFQRIKSSNVLLSNHVFLLFFNINVNINSSMLKKKQNLSESPCLKYKINLKVQCYTSKREEMCSHMGCSNELCS